MYQGILSLAVPNEPARWVLEPGGRSVLEPGGRAGDPVCET